MDRLRILRAYPLLARRALKKTTPFRAWVDGASRGNPGPASAGVVIRDADGATLKTLSIALGTATNNVAEYSALLLALQEAALQGASSVHLFTDSELVARQWSGQYKIKDAQLRVFHRLASHLAGHFKEVTVSHVPREANKEADAAANQA